MKTINVKAYNTKKITKELAVVTNDGQPTIIKAEKGINYEFFDQSIGRAPNHIITKRSGKDLHVSFERDGKETDLIIEGFYDNEDHALIGIAEDGQYYYYIPDTGEVSEYVTQLVEGKVEGQALGGEHLVAPWWVALPHGTGMPWWLGLGVLPVLFGGDGDSPTNTPEPKPTPSPSTAPVAKDDTQTATAVGVATTVAVVGNDSDPENNIDPTTVVITEAPAGSTIAADGKSVVVNGEGTWTVDPVTGNITFTPDTSFKGDPTPISYTVKDSTGLVSNPATVTLDYPAATAPVAKDDTQTATAVGVATTVAVVGNDSDSENNTDPTSVQIVGSTDGKTLVVNGEGSWTVDPVTGNITFTPEPNFKGDPTPISYTVKDSTGLESNPATVTIDYPQDAPVASNDTEAGTAVDGIAQPVTVNVLTNDSDPNNDLDPTSVQIVGSTDGKTLVVNGEGSWTVDPDTGNITFTPDADFKGDPTPISYTVKDSTGLESNPATVTIDYPAATAHVAINATDNVAIEGTDNTLVFSVSLDKAVAGDTTVLVKPTAGSVTPDDIKQISYTDVSGNVVTLTGPAPIQDFFTNGVQVKVPANGTTAPAITFTTVDDTAFENKDDMTLTISNPTNPVSTVTVGTASDTAVIFDEPALTDPNQPESPTNPPKTPVGTDPNQPISPTNPPADTTGDKPKDNTQVSIKATDNVAIEGTDNNTLVFSVSLDKAVAGDTTVLVKPTAGSVTPDDIKQISYTDVSGNVVTLTDPAPIQDFFTNGVQVKVPANGTTAPAITFTTVDDTAFENKDDMTLTISNPTNPVSTVTVGTASDTAVIFDEPALTDPNQPESPTNPPKTPVGTDPNQPISPTNPPADTTGDKPKDNTQVSIKATDNVAIEGTDNNTLVFSVSLDKAVAGDTTVLVKPTAGSVTPDDIKQISYTDVSGNVVTLTGPAPIQDFFTNGVQVKVPANGTTAPAITFTTVDDTAFENKDDMTLTISNPTNPVSTVTVGTASDTAVIFDEPALTDPNQPESPTNPPKTPVGTDPNQPISPTNPPADTTGDKPKDNTQVSIKATDNVAIEGTDNNTLVFSVSLDKAVAGDTTVLVKPTAGSVTPDDIKQISYTDVSGNVVTLTGPAPIQDFFTNGVQVKVPANGTTAPAITFTTVDDTAFENKDDMTLTISNPTNPVSTVTVGTASDTAVIFDEPAATAPVAEDDTQTATAVGVTTTVAVVGNDTDPENNIDPTSVQIVGSTDGKTLVVNGEGTWTVDPATGDITFEPDTSFKGDPTPISYTVKDSTGLVSNPATVTIDYPAATAPVAEDDTQTATAVGVTTTVAVVGNDTDANNDIDPTTVQIVGSTDGKTLVVAGEGTWTVNPTTGEITFTPEATFKGDPTPISYTVKDSTGLVSNPATVTVDYPQDPPVATNDTAAPTTAGTPVTVNVLGNDTDPENNIDPTSVQIVGSTDGKTLVVNGEGTWTVDPATGDITFTPEASFKGDPTPISYTVKDSTGLVSNPATVTVDYPQDPPVATNDTAAPTTAGTPVTVNVLGNDTDANNDIDPTTVQIVGSTDGKTLVVAGEGTWTVDPVTGNITFTPEASFKGDPTPISYTVKDSTGLESNPATVTIDYPAATAHVAINATDNVAIEGTDNTLVFSVSLDKAVAGDTTVLVKPTAGSVTPDDIKQISYTDVSGNVVTLTGPAPIQDFFTNGVQVKVPANGTTAPAITFTTVDDTAFENKDDMTLTISNPTNPVSTVTVGTASDTAVIFDEPALTDPNQPESPTNPPKTPVGTDPNQPISPTNPPADTTGDKPKDNTQVSIKATDNVAIEGTDNNTLVFSVSLDKAVAGDTTVLVKPTAGSVTPDDIKQISYTDVSGNVVTLTGPAPIQDFFTNGVQVKVPANGTTAPAITFTTVDDTAFENKDDMTLTISNPTNPVSTVTVGTASDTAVIFDEPALTDPNQPESPTNPPKTPVGTDPNQPISPTNPPADTTGDKPKDNTQVSIKATDNVAIEGTDNNTLVFSVSLDKAVAGDTTVLVKPTAGSVTPDDIKQISYTDVSGNVVTLTDPAPIQDFFTNGVQVKVPANGTTAPAITFTTVDDTAFENKDDMTLTISNPTNPVSTVTVGTASDTAVIFDEPALTDPNQPESPTNPPKTPVGTDPNQPISPTNPPADTTGDKPKDNTQVSIKATDNVAIEGTDNNTLVFSVSLDKAVAGDTTVLVKPTAGSVTPDDIKQISYTDVSGNVVTLTGPAPIQDFFTNGVQVKVPANGTTAPAITFTTVDDTAFENKDDMTLTISNPTNPVSTVTVGTASDTAVIFDEPALTDPNQPESPTNPPKTPVGTDPNQPISPTNPPADTTGDKPKDNTQVSIKATDNVAIEGTDNNTLVFSVSLDKAVAGDTTVLVKPTAGSVTPDDIKQISYTDVSGNVVTLTGPAPIQDFFTNGVQVKVPANGTTAPAITFTTVDDTAFENKDDMTLTISNPTNPVSTVTVGTASDTAVIFDEPAATAPVAKDDTQTATAVGVATTVAVVGNDSDPENNIDPTTVVITEAPAGSTIAADGKSVVVNGEGTWTVDPVTGNITFTPDTSFKGDPTPISYTVKDSTGLVSNPATVTLDYPAATAPVAKDDTQTATAVGVATTVAVVGNDSDPENNIDPTTVVITEAPAGSTIAADGKSVVVNGEGTWTVDPVTGNITFTPDTSFKGDPTPISYTVKDSTGLVSNPATVTLDYPAATAPVAKDDTQTATAVGVATTVAVVGNDSDSENNTDPTSVQIVGSTDGKTLVVNGEGSWTVDPVTGNITFTPEPNFKGDPTPISYTVKDSTGLESNPATVTIDYPQDAPVASNDTEAGTAVGVATTVAVVGNDSDSENNTDPTSVQIVGSTDGKTLVVNGEGSWTVDPVTGNITFTPEPNFKGDPTPISYTVKDSTGLESNPATVTIDYPQDAPVASNDTEAGTAVDGIAQPVTVNVLTNDSDPNNDLDPTTVQIVGSTDGKTLVVAGEGTWTVNPTTGEITFTPEATFKGDPTPISYTVKDSTGLVSNPATVTVDYPQDPPVATNDTAAPTTAGTPVTVNVLGNDTDANNDIDPTTVQIVGSTDGKTLVVAGEGTWTVNPTTGEITFTPEASFKGDPTPISYTVKDSTGLVSNPATVTVDYPQDPPVATNDTAAPTTAGTPVTVAVVGNDTDANNDIDPTTVQIVGSTDGKTLVVAGEGTWTVNPTTGEITFTPEATFKGDPTPISYTVKDSTGLVSNPATVTVDYPQDPPVATNDTAAPTTAGTPVTVNVLGNDTDANNDIDPTTVQIVGSTDGKTLVVAGEGTWTVDPATGDITFEPDTSFKGDPTPISYTVKDSTGNTSNPATVTVDYPQDPPVATNDTAAPTTAGTPVTVNVLTNDSDPNNNLDPTTVVITQAPAGSTIAADGKSVVVAGQGTWTVDPVTGNITFKPDTSFKGDPTPISYTVKDSTGLVSNPATVTIDYPQDKPVASNDTQAGTAVGGIAQPVTVNVLTNDSDPNNNLDPTTVVITQAPAGSTIAADGKSVVVAGQGTWTVDPTTGEITFTPEATFKGDPTPISYTVKDSTGLVSNPATVTIDYPAVVLTSKLAVSEEALTYGIKDSVGNPTDTTDSAAATGSFGTATSAITTISAPTTAVYSGGEKVIWTSANGVLTGKTETTGVDVIKVTSGAFAAATGAGYTVTLLKAIDHPTAQNENTLDITFDVQTSTEMGKITLTVEDDAPVTTNATLTASSDTISSFYANVNLIMDLSGSTAYASSIPGKTVFQAMKDSVNELLDYYQGKLDQAGGNGDVRVDISVFADFAKHLSLDGSTPSYWVSLADAKKLLNTIQPPDNNLIDNGVGFGTNYDAALQEMIKGYQQSNVGPLQNKPGLTNSAYFITDGSPNSYPNPTSSDPNNTGWNTTPGHSGINPGSFSGYVAGGYTEIGEKNWTDFLTANEIKAYAIGLGSSVDIASITPISYDGTTATNADAILAKPITDYSQLDAFLTATVTTTPSAPAPLTATGLMESGADANYTASMTVDNITYTYQTSTGEITSDYAHTAWKDLGNGDLQVITHSGATVSLQLGQGANLGNMTYQAPSSILTSHTSETIGYTITDGDGDKASGTATIDLSALPKLVEHALQASTSTTVAGTANVADVFTLSGLTNNGSDTITNFEVGTDKLGFSGIKQISDLNNISAQASGGNTVVHFTTADTIASHLTLTGVTLDTTTIQNWLVNNSVIM